jgi:putative DNA primase/helicase
MWQTKGELVNNLDALAVPGRTFRIRFDMDVLFKPGVLLELKKLAKALEKRGCKVLVAKWDKELGLKIDDVKVKHGPEMVQKIMSEAQPYAQWLKSVENQINNIAEARDTRDSVTTSKKPPTPREIAARLAEQYGHRWKYDDEQKTWRVYSGKHWEKVGLGAFTSLVKTTIDAKDVNYTGSAYIKDVVELLQCDLRQIRWQYWDRKRYINFNNCVLDGEKLATLEHSPGMGFTSFLPFDYKVLEGDLSDALEALRVNCPSIHKFFRTAMQDDERKILKLLAICNAILKHRFFDLQMFVHLVGAPGSGKGTFARLMEKLVGRENFKGCQLDRLSDGSTKASVVDKQLVVFADERKPVGIDSILSFTGGDAVSYRELHTPAADAFFYGCFLICSNKPIFVGDTTGLERRLCLVHFDNPIPTEKRDHSIENQFEDEIPALIGIALSLTDLAVTQAIRGIGSERIAEFKAKEWEMKVETSSTAAFFDMELVLDPTATTRTGKLYDAYKYFCEESGFSKVSIVKFPKLLADLLTDENLPFTRHQGAQAYFEGIRLREESDMHLTHSETLAGVEGVEEGVTGSSQGVGEGVEPSEYKRLRELRQLQAKILRLNPGTEDFLPDDEESDQEVEEIKDLPPSTPSTPSNVVPVGDITPSVTPSQVPLTPPQTPLNVGSKHQDIKEGDQVVITEKGAHEGQYGTVVHIGYGSRETDYQVLLDKESHFVRTVTVTIPQSALMNALYLMKE